MLCRSVNIKCSVCVSVKTRPRCNPFSNSMNTTAAWEKEWAAEWQHSQAPPSALLVVFLHRKKIKYLLLRVLYNLRHGPQMEMSFLLNLVHSHRCVSACVFFIKGVRIAHPHHRRRAAGHGDRTVLWCVGTDQRPGCHPVLLSTEHLLQKGKLPLTLPAACVTPPVRPEVLKCWAHLTSRGFL